ncbi:hypothetical protein ABT354_26845 [Streptomyces sp. NPDC000594]|uniref:hypothetical protein n=1 Tax=Streptomyces sp. NPDC000594 TaxID=3154261 RepID=UPI00332C814D
MPHGSHPAARTIAAATLALLPALPPTLLSSTTPASAAPSLPATAGPAVCADDPSRPSTAMAPEADPGAWCAAPLGTGARWSR